MSSAGAPTRKDASALRTFLVHYGHFVTGQALNMLLGLMSFPILTRILSPEDYGILGLVTSTMMVMMAFAKAGLSDGIVRFYREYSDTQARKDVFSSSIIVRGFVLASIVVVLYVALFPLAIGHLGISRHYLNAFLMIGVVLLVRPQIGIVLNVMRATGKTVAYAVYNFSQKLASIVLSLVLFVYVIPHVWGYFLGIAMVDVVGFVVLLRWFLRHYQVSLGSVSGELTMRLVKFGAPLLVTEMAYLLLTYVDRYMIIGYHDEGALGLYSVGYNLASYVGELLMFSLANAVIPIYVRVYQDEGRERTEEFLSRCLYYWFVAAIPIFFGYLAISHELFITLASEKYAQAATFSPVILAASLFLGVNYILNAGLYIAKRSLVLLSVMGATLVINVAANMVLLPRFGIEGAATAKLIAAVGSTALTVALSFRYLKVSLPVGTIIYYVALSAAMYLVLEQVHASTTWVRLLEKIAVGAAVIVTGVLLRERELSAKLLGLLRRRRAIGEH